MAKRNSSSSSSSKKKKSPTSTRSSKRLKVAKEEEIENESPEIIHEEGDGYEDALEENEPVVVVRKVTGRLSKGEDIDCHFVGDPVPLAEAQILWPHRFPQKNEPEKKKSEQDNLMRAKRHYMRAEIDQSIIFEINDHAHVKSDDDKMPYICKIVEMFVGVDDQPYFTANWYYRTNDTVIKKIHTIKEFKRIYPSEVKDDNPLDCLIEKIKVVRVASNLDVTSKMEVIPDCHYYYDMLYSLEFSSFIVPPPDDIASPSGSQSTISCENGSDGGADDVKPGHDEVVNQGQLKEPKKSELILLDLYCGCGAMSTGLCQGAIMAGKNLVTKWSIDINKHACASLALNHPDTKVRIESVEDFLELLKEWQKMCASFLLINSNETHGVIDAMGADDGDVDVDGDDNEEKPEEEIEEEPEEDVDNIEVFEVDKILDICYGDPKGSSKPGLYLKVRWKNFGPSEDSWEPIDGLGNCRESIGEFVRKGYAEKLLPLPGDVDVISGGPPCQGISGFNRFRNKENPLADPQNYQLIVYMNVVDFLKPKFVLMENVVDLLKFSHGYLGRYAVGRLVDMNYQVRIGMMAAGFYGLPQFRMRVFVWGAIPSENLPQYPIPTHAATDRGVVPTEFENNKVVNLDGDVEAKLFLEDAISDLPQVENNEHRDEMPYARPPETEFQRFIRVTKDSIMKPRAESELITTLYDHRPLQLNRDDYERVCKVPKRKGANFRDLGGVRVSSDNKVEWIPNSERALLASGKPLIPDYAMTYVGGTSTKPFGRLWWDETVPTVVTRAEPHNQAVMHPVQDRVLTIRENARLQGFPDYYQLVGPVKQRYMQVGNAVAVPVARALGYALAKAVEGSSSRDQTFKLPPKFPNIFDGLGEEKPNV